MKFIPPEFRKNGYNCPHCDTFAHQIWHKGCIEVLTTRRRFKNPVKKLNISLCERCGKYSLWVNKIMVYPDSTSIPIPNEDLNDDIKTDYLEAASIVNKSPRGAAALLRLAIQKICIQLGEPGKNLNTDIGNLVERGLSTKTQKALDTVRVIGNEAVHPGQMDIKDDIQTAKILFELVNIIAETMITSTKRVDAMYNKLPESKIKEIEKRDSKSTK